MTASTAEAVTHETRPGLFTINIPAGIRAAADGTYVAPHKWKLNGLSLTCATTKYSGEALTVGPSSTETKFTPTYETCHVVVAGITKLVTVTPNHCSYTWNATTTTTADGSIDKIIDTEVHCEKAGESIEIHVYNSAASEATTLCTYDIEPQGPLAGITAANKVNTPTSADDIEASVNVTAAAHVTITSALCGANAIENIVFEGTLTVQGTSEAGQLVDVSISD